MSKQNPFPAIPEPQPTVESLQRTVKAMKEIIELLTGQRGDGSKAAVLKG